MYPYKPDLCVVPVILAHFLCGHLRLSPLIYADKSNVNVNMQFMSETVSHGPRLSRKVSKIQARDYFECNMRLDQWGIASPHKSQVNTLKSRRNQLKINLSNRINLMD